jgi:uncharacterized protein
MEGRDRAFTARSFQQFVDERRLMGSRCRSCGALHLPPRPMCPVCHGGQMDWAEMAGRGRLLAFTSIYIAPTAMIEAGFGRDKPYYAGIVQLEEGPAISAQIVGLDPARPEAIRVGMPVRAAFVQRGEGEAARTCLAFEA